MTDKPIIFSAPMVRALLAGTKTQTRRILKPQPPEWVTRMTHEGRCGWIGSGDGHGTLMHAPCAVGDRLWAREAFATTGGGPVRYYATDDVHELRRKRSPIHMPRWASRLTLLVTDVRVQRLQEISSADAIAEGCPPYANSATIDCDTPNPRDDFKRLWNSIHGPGAWDASPWVCAISFDMLRGNIDDAEAVAARKETGK